MKPLQQNTPSERGGGCCGGHAKGDASPSAKDATVAPPANADTKAGSASGNVSSESKKESHCH